MSNEQTINPDRVKTSVFGPGPTSASMTPDQLQRSTVVSVELIPTKTTVTVNLLPDQIIDIFAHSAFAEGMEPAAFYIPDDLIAKLIKMRTAYDEDDDRDLDQTSKALFDYFVDAGQDWPMPVPLMGDQAQTHEGPAADKVALDEALELWKLGESTGLGWNGANAVDFIQRILQQTGRLPS